MPLKSLARGVILLVLSGAAPHAAGAEARLVEAVRNADKATIRALLEQRVDVNAQERDGTTALHWAVGVDDVETAELLIRAGADVKTTNRYGVRSLSLACTNGNAAMIELLLKAGADPNTTLPEGETALMTSARTGRVEPVRLLLAHGADANATESRRRQTPLMWAAADGHTAVVQALLESGADIHARSSGGFTPLLLAVREGKIDVVRVLLGAGAEIDEPLSVANASRSEFPSAPGDPAAGPSALVVAVWNAHYELAAALLDAGADPNAAAHGWTALHQVTWVRKPGTGDSFPYPSPAGSGDMDSLDFVRRLVAHGTNVNARVRRRPNVGFTSLNPIGATPFLMAARTGDAALMRLLAELGADPLLSNEDNTTPLMAAAGVGTYSPGQDAGTESEVLEAVRVAWELGGDVDAVDNDGNTAMHGAGAKHFPSVVRYLMEKGASIEVWNRKNKAGWTPLDYAEGVRRGNNIRISLPTAAAIREAMGGAAPMLR